MVIATYADLVNTIKRWLNREDVSDDDISTFIYFAGNAANQTLRVPPMEYTSILPISEGGKITIPVDFLELKSLTYETGSDESYPLERVAWDQFVNYRNRDPGVIPRFFAQQGPYIFITPEPAVDSNVTMHYYRSMPDLSPEFPFNWLSDLSPMSYLFGSLHYANLFLFQEERAEYWLKKYQAELQRIQDLADMAATKGSALTIRLRETSGVH